MNNKLFDKTKPVQTKDGRKARIVAELNDTTYPLVVVITHKNGVEQVQQYQQEGFIYGPRSPNNLDLVNIPEKHKIEAWFNVYRHYEGALCLGDDSPTEARAKAACNLQSVVARVHATFEFEEGQGL